MKILKIVFISFALILLTRTTYSQIELISTETQSKVPELENFHDVIFPIWHTAYPAKDYPALKGYKNIVNKYAEKIYNAKLNGILRDKQEKWENGLVEFKQAVDDYNNAADGDVNETLLLAAENLHLQYEKLVRVIRPALKEADLFHQMLYVIYHKYMPEKNYQKIISVSSELSFRAKQITEAKLPQRLQSKKNDFNQTASELFTATEKLKQLDEKSKPEDIELAVESVHSKYEALEEIF